MDNRKKVYYSNPLSITSQFPFCGLPLRMDTYLGCSFGCIYCFSKDRGGNYKYVSSRPANPNSIINYFKPSNRKRGGVINQMIERKVPIHLGGMSDPFQSLEKKIGVTKQVLEFLCDIKYPLVISTKSILPTKEPYLSFLKSNPNILIQYSFCSVLDRIATTLEPYSSSPTSRLKAMEIFEKNGVKTACRWQPYIPYTSIDEKNFLKSIANTGSKYITFEYLKVPIETKRKEIFNLDYRKKYLITGAKRIGRELVLLPENKIDTIKRIRELAHECGLIFGAADNEFHHFSDTPCCCSGVASLPGFENWFKFQISYAIIKSKQRDFDFSIISDEWRPKGLINRQVNSHSRLNKTDKNFGTMEDYLQYYWNKTDSVFNPLSYYGVKLKNDDSVLGNTYSWKED